MPAAGAAPAGIVDDSMIEINGLTRRFGAHRHQDVSFTCRARQRDRVPRPERRGQDHHHAAAVRPGPAGQRAAPPSTGTRTRDLPQPGRRVGVPARRGPSTAAGPAARRSPLAAAALGAAGAARRRAAGARRPGRAAAAKRVGQYSLGMQQRLAPRPRAARRPGVLVLDEPANGLDPQGVRWIRELLARYADRGGTVLLSSHLLARGRGRSPTELIIIGGRIRAQGTSAELLTESRTISRRPRRPRCRTSPRGSAEPPGGRRPAAGRGRARGRRPRGDVRPGVVLCRLAPAEDAGLERLFFELTTSGASTPSTRTDSIHLEPRGATA